MSIVLSLFYLCSCAFLIAGFFWFPRTRERENLIVWLIVCIVFYECWTALVCGIFSLARIPVSLVSVGIVNFVLLAALFAICRKKYAGGGLVVSGKAVFAARQRFSLSPLDLAFAILLAVLLYYVWHVRFGGDAAIIYATIDPSDRYSRALGILSEQTVIGPYPNLYFGHISNALFLGLTEPVWQGAASIRAFEIKELINVWIAGMLFFAALRQLSDKPFAKAVFFVLGFAYTLGFPWNNELWGFGYLGLSVSLMIFVQIGTRLLCDERQAPWIGFLIISAGCLGVGLSYTMFAPPVYIAAFLAIALQLRKKARLAGILFVEIFVFAVPVILTLAFSVLIGKGDAGSDLGAQFTIEGAIYRSLLGDFLIWLPFALFALIFMIYKRKWDFSVLLAIAFAAFQVYFLIGMVRGTVSTYYYYKLNFGTWFIVLFLAGLALSLLADDGNRRAMAMVACYLAVFFAAAVFTVRGYDYELSQRGENMNPISAASGLFGIYTNNNAYFNHPENDPIYYTADFLALCDAARTERGMQDGAGSDGNFYTNRIEIVTDNFRDAYWADALVREHIEQKPVSGIERLPDGEATIWIVLKNSALYRDHAGEIDALKRVYENDIGFVALLSHSGRETA